MGCAGDDTMAHAVNTTAIVNQDTKSTMMNPTTKPTIVNPDVNVTNKDTVNPDATQLLLAAKGFTNLALDLYRFKAINKYKEPSKYTLYYDTDCPPPDYTAKNCEDLNIALDNAFQMWKNNIITEKKLELRKTSPFVQEIDGCHEIAKRLQSSLVAYKDQDKFKDSINDQISDYEVCLKFEQSKAFGQSSTKVPEIAEVVMTAVKKKTV